MVDIRKGNVVSEKPVEVEMLQGTLNANRLEIVNSGELVRFDGGVNMTVMLDSAARRAPSRSQGGGAMTVPRHRAVLHRRCVAGRARWRSAGAPLHAPQPSKGPPNALQGFSQNRDQPVHIEAATLEVRDKDKVATFSGDVQWCRATPTCAASRWWCSTNRTTAGAGKSKTLKAAQPGPGGQQKIKRLEARGGVVVTQKEQTATGETGVFDMKTNTVTLTGNVVMTPGQNVLRGERLVVDLTTGVSRVESGKNGTAGCKGLFQPGSGPSSAPLDNAGCRAELAGAATAIPIDPQRARSRVRIALAAAEESANVATSARSCSANMRREVAR